jgi:Mg2+ and Co2+ transporter CorA
MIYLDWTLLKQNPVMIEDTLSKIEAKIESSDAITADRKRELLQLIHTLKNEVASLSKTHGDQAESIAGFAEVSAHEATRPQQNPELLQLSLKGLSSSVTGFEKSHPQLVQIVNAISNTLANLGI